MGQRSNHAGFDGLHGDRTGLDSGVIDILHPPMVCSPSLHRSKVPRPVPGRLCLFLPAFLKATLRDLQMILGSFLVVVFTLLLGVCLKYTVQLHCPQQRSQETNPPSPRRCGANAKGIVLLVFILLCCFCMTAVFSPVWNYSARVSWPRHCMNCARLGITLLNTVGSLLPP